MARRKKKKVDTANSQLNMTPMIDVIFQLLIFFMVGAKFKSVEGQIQAYLPKDQGQSAASPQNVELQDVRVKLLFRKPDGTFVDPQQDLDPNMEGEVVLKVNEDVFGSIQRFGETVPDYDRLVEYLSQQSDRYTGNNPEGLPVIIDARRQVPFQHVVYALNACVEANIHDVKFAAPEHPY